jgi:hypothetical protein
MYVYKYVCMYVCMCVYVMIAIRLRVLTSILSLTVRRKNFPEDGPNSEMCCILMYKYI